jgi:hypothetical protein
MSRGVAQGMLLLAAVIAACSAVTNGRNGIVFSHHLHTEQGIGCIDCHGAVERDAEQRVQAVPGKPGCADCHDVESEADCGSCHRDTDDPGSWDRPEPGSRHLLFSHQLHGERSSDCADCHGDAAHAPELAAGELAPGHDECGACHRADLEAGRCRLCHDRLDLYQRRPETFYSHEENFFDRHGARAKGNQTDCAVCHDQSFCADCHARTMTVRPSLRFPERVDRRFVHRGDWQTRHAFEARAYDTSCLKCHGTSFCSSCHERTGVGGAIGRKNPHPPEWMLPGTAKSHSRAARRRIAECASCHDQGPASNCVMCHASGGVNPHPPGWRPPVPASEKTTHRMCRICHGF